MGDADAGHTVFLGALFPDIFPVQTDHPEALDHCGISIQDLFPVGMVLPVHDLDLGQRWMNGIKDQKAFVFGMQVAVVDMGIVSHKPGAGSLILPEHAGIDGCMQAVSLHPLGQGLVPLTILRHSHNVNGIYITQAGEHGEYLGYIRARLDTVQNSFSHFQYTLLPVSTSGVTPRSEIAAIVDSLKSTATQTLNTVIGTLQTDWNRNRHGESNLGNWLTDVMREYADADIAFQNSGGIRKDLPAGPIRIRDLWEISPFGNHFVRFHITGQQLLKIIRHQITDPREFLQVSGLQYRYRTGTRELLSAQVGGTQLRPDSIYIIVTNNYVHSHFEEFFGLPVSSVQRVSHLPAIDREVFTKAVRDQGTISSRIEGRIRAVD